MQAWWESYPNHQWQLRNSFHIPVAFTREESRWSFAVGNDVNGTLDGKLSISEAKNIVANKFAGMLIEQATAVLTIGA